MLVMLQALAFTGCVLLDMLTRSEVECRFAVPLIVWAAPPPAALEEEPAPEPPPLDDEPVPGLARVDRSERSR